MCPDELRAVRFVVKSVDSQAISDIFIKAVRCFMEELTYWRKNGGNPTDYNETRHVIASKLPQVVVFQEQTIFQSLTSVEP